jgi:hypothetical protein
MSLRLSSVQPGQIGLAEAQRPRLCNLGLGPADLGGRASRHDRATFGEAAVDPFGGGGSADLVDSALHGQLHGPGSVGAVLARDERTGSSKQCRAPTPVPPRGTEASHLALEKGNAGARRRPEQVVRRPKPGEPGAHHRHIDVDVAVQGRPRGQAAREPVPPKRQGPQAHLIRSVHARFMILEPRPGVATKRGCDRRTELGGPLREN